jgi:hypothetical protein
MFGSQVAPLLQVVPQQGSPAAPQAVQLPLSQVNLVEHCEPVQQSWFMLPQAWQVPSLPHRFPAAQVAPSQHCWVAPPQSPQVPAAEQVTPPVHGWVPAQQS